jgi:hypothetical protein
MTSESKRSAQRRYDKKNTTQVLLKLNTKTDADVIGKLTSVDNKQGYLKELVRSNLRNNSGILPFDSLRLLVIPVAKKNKLDCVSLFGSYARGEAGSGSDVDLLISGGDYVGLFGFLEIKEQFEKALGKKVDLISRESLDENKSASGLLFKENVIKDEKVIYER